MLEKRHDVEYGARTHPSRHDQPATPMNILFDLDGTLTDPYRGIRNCIAHALDVLGAPVPERLEWGY